MNIYHLPNINKSNNDNHNIFFNSQKENSEIAPKSVTTENIGMVLKEMVDSIFDPTTAMTDKQREDFEKEIQRKIEKGEKLTYDEMQYLRIHNPIQYAKMIKVQMKREALERRLETCKSKKEAQEVYIEAVSRLNKEDSALKETLAAYDNAMEEFKKSDHYQKLPQEEDKTQKEDKNKKSNPK